MAHSPLSQCGQTMWVDKEVDLIHCEAWYDDNLPKHRRFLYYGWCAPREKSQHRKQEQVPCTVYAGDMQWVHDAGTNLFSLFYEGIRHEDKSLTLFTRKDLSRTKREIPWSVSAYRLWSRGHVFNIGSSYYWGAAIIGRVFFLGRAIYWQTAHASLYLVA